MSLPVLPYQCMNSFNQEIARTLVRKLSAVVSMLGSLYVLRLICKKWRDKRSSVDSYQRIMAGLCVYDILFSFFWWFMGSWMTPAATGWWGAVGNSQSCTAQGALTDFALIGIWSYQTLLSLFMLLLVTFGWSPKQFEERIELRLHPIILLCALAYMIPPLFYQGYNPECGHCAPVPLPLTCGSWLFGNGSECKRGSPTLAYVYWIVFFTLLPAVTVFCSGAMYKVYRTVRDQEERRSSIRSFRDGHHRESKRIRRTMVLYTGSFYLCWIFPIFFLWIPHKVATLKIIGDILMPLQGLFTMLVFIQPKCVKYQHTYPGTSLLEAYFCVIFKLDRFQAAIRRLSSTADRPSPYEDDDGVGFSLRFHAMIRRLSSTADRPSPNEDDDGVGFSLRFLAMIRRLSSTADRPSPYEDDDGIGFQNYNPDPPSASEGEDVEKSIGTFETEEVKTTSS